MIEKGKLNMLIGISFGSEGKGNVAAYLGKNNDFALCISNNSPNAGHQFKNEENVTETVKMLPVSGIVDKGCNIMLGSGSVIDINRLLEEVERYGVQDRLIISPYAPVVTDYCREYEREHLKYIASTFQGTGAAIGLKAMRSKDIKLAKDYPELKKWIRPDYSDLIMKCIGGGGTGLVEICQGYGLTVDSEHYPYTTSRCVNVGQSLAYLDLPPSMVGDVIGIARSYIIRVGNVEGGTSGSTFDDSHEITWDELSQKLGRNVLEMTTVTKRVRRVFTFSKKLFEMGVRRNGVNVAFLTFVDYLTKAEADEMADYLLSSKFGFKNVYFVHGFGNFDKTIEQVR